MDADSISFEKFLSQIKLSYYDGVLKEKETGFSKEDKGVLIKSSGSYYEGQFLQSKMNGKGTYFNYNKKKKYEGEFKEGLKQGQGK